ASAVGSRDGGGGEERSGDGGRGLFGGRGGVWDWLAAATGISTARRSCKSMIEHWFPVGGCRGSGRARPDRSPVDGAARSGRRVLNSELSLFPRIEICSSSRCLS